MTVDKSKKVSVVMCTYNGTAYLREQLDSIVNQSYPIFELIIQDDRSTDNTIQLIEEYQKIYPFITFSINEQNLGAYHNFKQALKKANGEFIAISDQDDIWELSKIEKQIEHIGNYSLCFSLSLSFGEGISIDREHRIPNHNILRQLFYPILPGHAMLFRKEVLSHIPAEEKGFAYDLLLAMAAELFGGITAYPEVLNHHRRHLSAHSYITPTNYTKNFDNIYKYVTTGIGSYFKKREVIRSHFKDMHTLLASFNPNRSDEYVKDALLFSEYMSKGKMFGAALICIKRRKGIFYSQENGGVTVWLRAALFPLLCSHYY